MFESNELSLEKFLNFKRFYQFRSPVSFYILLAACGARYAVLNVPLSLCLLVSSFPPLPLLRPSLAARWQTGYGTNFSPAG
jgi:hypothetical protein